MPYVHRLQPPKRGRRKRDWVHWAAEAMQHCNESLSVRRTAGGVQLYVVSFTDELLIVNLCFAELPLLCL